MNINPIVPCKIFILLTSVVEGPTPEGSPAPPNDGGLTTDGRSLVSGQQPLGRWRRRRLVVVVVVIKKAAANVEAVRFAVKHVASVGL